jgi:hypothetical protein
VSDLSNLIVSDVPYVDKHIFDKAKETTNAILVEDENNPKGTAIIKAVKLLNTHKNIAVFTVTAKGGREAVYAPLNMTREVELSLLCVGTGLQWLEIFKYKLSVDFAKADGHNLTPTLLISAIKLKEEKTNKLLPIMVLMLDNHKSLDESDISFSFSELITKTFHETNKAFIEHYGSL